MRIFFSPGIAPCLVLASLVSGVKGFALFAREPPRTLVPDAGIVPRLALSRRELIASIPAALPTSLLASTAATAADDIGAPGKLKPVGYRATTVVVGGQTVPVALWYPLSSDDNSQPAAASDRPYNYRIGIGNLFKVFLGFELPIPNPEVRSGDAAVRVGGAPQANCGNGIIFAHGMLGSRFDMAELCASLAREGFVVSAADFAESISASYAPNESTTRGAIIDAETELLRRDFSATSFGIVGHSAGGGSATMTEGPFALGRCAIAGARPYSGGDPLYIVASEGDGVIPLDRVRTAVPPGAVVASDPADVRWDRSQRSAALLLEGPVAGAAYAPNHISFLDEEANAALVKVLSPLLPLAKLLKLPVLDFDVYVERKDARQTAAAVRPSIVKFFLAQKR